jgi:hypothetical protein
MVNLHHRPGLLNRHHRHGLLIVIDSDNDDQ